MKNFNSENIKSVTKSLVELGICSVYLAIASRIVFGKNILRKHSVSSGYYEAVTAIINSSMYDSSKRNAIEAIKRDGTDEYYKSVISIIGSDMFDIEKIRLIKAMD